MAKTREPFGGPTMDDGARQAALRVGSNTPGAGMLPRTACRDPTLTVPTGKRARAAFGAFIGKQRYQLTRLGRRVAVLFTKAYGGVLAPGLSAVDARLPEDVAAGHPLTKAWRQWESVLDAFIQGELIAA